MPRRHRGLRPAAERVLRHRPGPLPRTLVGNHDLVALGSADVGLEDFNPEAAAASRWTTKELTPDSREFLASLEPAAKVEGFELYHGSPRDPVWEYVLDEAAVVESFMLTQAPVVLVGHSHVATAAVMSDETIEGGVRRGGLLGRARRRALAAQSGLGRPAAGRRSACRLASPRPRVGRGSVQADRLPCRANPGGDQGKGVARFARGASGSRRVALLSRSPSSAAAETTARRSRRSPAPGSRARSPTELADLSDEVAGRLESGDRCGAGEAAARLTGATSPPRSTRARFPRLYLEELSGAANELELRSAAVHRRGPTAPSGHDEDETRTTRRGASRTTTRTTRRRSRSRRRRPRPGRDHDEETTTEQTPP